MNPQGTKEIYLGSSRLREVCHPCRGLCGSMGSMLSGAVLSFFLSFPLDRKGPKGQGQNKWPTRGRPKCLTFRLRSDFCEVKRQTPLCEGQALSRPLQALPRTSAMPPHPTRWSVGVPALCGLFLNSRTTKNPTHPLASSRAVPEPVEGQTRDLLSDRKSF